MKQTIRVETFETNSSSYHTVTITDKSKFKPSSDKTIAIGKETVLDSRIKIDRHGGDDYTYISRSPYDKANMLLRYMYCVIENYDYDIGGETQRGWLLDKSQKPQYFDTHPLAVALKNAISDFTGASVTIKWKSVDYVVDEYNGIDDILGVKASDLTNVEILTERMKDIIFNDDIEIEEAEHCN